MYARYRTRSRFYKRSEKVLKAYNVTPNLLRRPIVKKGLISGIYTDESVDLRDKNRLEMLESIRHPCERDFYQDHTYHNQWIMRDLKQDQKKQLATRYKFFAPNYEIKPWIWYPGDVVEVVKGEGAGQRGTILAVVKYKNEIVVQNVNVRDVVIPASETRPEQVLQREHPICVTSVQHVDPSTNEMCHLEPIKVRNRKSGVLEETRISLESGVLLPIPSREDEVAVGDPLKDTALQDADEVTYDPDQEMQILVERRLQEMENHFVKMLKESYAFHELLRVKNGEQLQAFQMAVLDAAAGKLAKRICGGVVRETPASGALLAKSREAGTAEGDGDLAVHERPAWWHAMVRSHVRLLEEEMLAADAARQSQMAEGETENVGHSSAGDEDDDNEDDRPFDEYEEVTDGQQTSDRSGEGEKEGEDEGNDGEGK